MPALPLSACETLETVVILFSLNTSCLSTASFLQGPLCWRNSPIPTDICVGCVTCLDNKIGAEIRENHVKIHCMIFFIVPFPLP